jgi:hypothetical protein
MNRFNNIRALGRSAHQALVAFWQQATQGQVRWLPEVDIRKYFDSVSRTGLLELIRPRVVSAAARQGESGLRKELAPSG